MATLEVYYKMRRSDGGELIWEDGEIEALVGQECNAAGTNLMTGVRDLSFDMTKGRLKAAQAALAAAGYRFQVTS